MGINFNQFILIQVTHSNETNTKNIKIYVIVALLHHLKYWKKYSQPV